MNVIDTAILLQALTDFLRNRPENRCPDNTSKARIMGWTHETELLLEAVREGRMIIIQTKPADLFRTEEDS